MIPTIRFHWMSLTQSDDDNKHLYQELFGDVLVATTVTAAIAPLLTTVDAAVVQRTSATGTTGTISVRHIAQQTMAGILRNPVAYVKSPAFLFMWGAYAATYTTANVLQTIAAHRPSQSSSSSSTSQGTHRPWALLAGTTAVNSAASVVKDQAYAKIYANASQQAANHMQAVPRISYALWLLRDALVMGSSFVVPPLVAKYYQQHYAHHDDDRRDHKNSRVFRPSPATIQHISQVASPMMAQVIATPLHYLALDHFNRPSNHATFSALSVWQRLSSMPFTELLTIRLARILPAYGMGGIGNARLRQEWKQWLLARRIHNWVRGETSQRPVMVSAQT